jgi:hypothetical protein
MAELSQRKIDESSSPELFASIRDYVSDRLEYGSQISALFGLRLASFHSAHTFHGESTAEEFTRRAHGLSLKEADDGLERYIDTIYRDLGSLVVVIEDDLARRGDSNSDSGVIYVADRVVRTHCVADPADARDAVRALREGASVLALNAYVVPVVDLPMLRPGINLDLETRTRIANNAVAYLTHYWDEEAFLVLTET